MNLSLISAMAERGADMLLPVAEQSLDWLTTIVTAIVTSVGSIMLGVVLFTLVLKLITLPLDYFSRASMRKSSLKMEQMRPELEKLQKQYANDKNLYNQKMMALYKKEGYSPFGACLPTIITLVFFFIVLSSFNNYSNYQNIQYALNMTAAYNQAMVQAGVDEADGYLSYDEKTGGIVIDDQKIYDAYQAIESESAVKEIVAENGTVIYVEMNIPVPSDGTANRRKATYQTAKNGEKGFLVLIRHYEINEDGTISFRTLEEAIDEEALSSGSAVGGRYETLTVTTGEKTENFQAYYTGVSEASETTMAVAAEDFVKSLRRAASAEKYYEERESFLWIKNVWEADSPFAHPVTSYETITGKLSGSDKIREDQYAEITYNLSVEKEQPNGYFIIIVLVAGLSFLSQWVMSRGQKAQLELQSVDGTGAMQNKMMMWMMPIMMAIFAFMYTAAFSTYIICSQVFSMLTTLAINKIVDIRFYKEQERKEAEAMKGNRGIRKKEEAPRKRR